MYVTSMVMVRILSDSSKYFTSAGAGIHYPFQATAARQFLAVELAMGASQYFAIVSLKTKDHIATQVCLWLLLSLDLVALRVGAGPLSSIESLGAS